MTDPLNSPAGGVFISKEDLQIIIEGLREMPEAVTRMANSTELLARNVNRSPTRAYMAVVVVATAVISILYSTWTSDQVKDTLQDFRNEYSDYTLGAEQRGKLTREAVERVEDCLDFVTGAADNQCARQLLAMNALQLEERKRVIECSIQLGFARLAEQNPHLEIEPIKVDEVCK